MPNSNRLANAASSFGSGSKAFGGMPIGFPVLTSPVSTEDSAALLLLGDLSVDPPGNVAGRDLVGSAGGPPRPSRSRNPATSRLSAFIRIDKTGGVVPSEHEQDRLASETVLGRLVLRSRRRNVSFKETDALQGTDRTANLILGQIDVGMLGDLGGARKVCSTNLGKLDEKRTCVRQRRV
jgi:hypothetical protein